MARRISIQCYIKKGLPQIKILGIPQTKGTELASKIQTLFSYYKLPLPYENIQLNVTPGGISYRGYLELSFFISLYSTLFPGKLPWILEETLFLGEINLYGELFFDTDGEERKLIYYAKSLGFRNIIYPSIEGTCPPFKDMNFYSIKDIGDILTNNYRKLELATIPQKETKQSDTFMLEDIKKILPLLAGKHPIYIIEKNFINKKVFLENLLIFLPEPDAEEQEEIFLSRKQTDSIPAIIINSSLSKKELAGTQSPFSEGIFAKYRNGLLLVEEISSFSRDRVLLFKEILEKKFIDFLLQERKIPHNFWILFFDYPCPCGNYFHPEEQCLCSHKEIKKYHSHVDLHLRNHIEAVFLANNSMCLYTAQEIEKLQGKMKKAISVQKERYKEENFRFNAFIPAEKIDRYCVFQDGKTEAYFHEATVSFSREEKDSIRRIARSVADFHGNPYLSIEDIRQALFFKEKVPFYETPGLKNLPKNP